MTWEVLAKQVPWMRLTRYGVSFSVGLLRKAEAATATHATILFDEDEKRVGVKFHAEKTSHSFVLTRPKHGAVVQSTRIWKNYPWIDIKALRGVRLRAQLDKKNAVWFVTVPERR